MMTKMWRINGDSLEEVGPHTLDSEQRLEDWIAKDPRVLGINILIIGRQAQTRFGGRIDLLGMNEEGDIYILELKRGRTPRDIVAQTLDYASWVKSLSTREIFEIGTSHLGVTLDVEFRNFFNRPLPENLNTRHKMVIIASEIDPSSRRIVEYLSEEYGVSINTVFFTVFKENDSEFLTADWLIDQEEAETRSDRYKAPWSGFYYANADLVAPRREWDDMQEHGFFGAGGARVFSDRLRALSKGDHLYLYEKGAGYIGFGEVVSECCPIDDFVTPNGKRMKEIDLKTKTCYFSTRRNQTKWSIWWGSIG